MSSADVLFLILVIAVIAFFVVRNRRRKALPFGAASPSTASPAAPPNAALGDYVLANSHLALKESQKTHPLHGVSIYALSPFNGTYDNLSCSCGTNTYDNVSDLDTSMNTELVDLISEGFRPSINTVVNNSVVVFYITY